MKVNDLKGLMTIKSIHSSISISHLILPAHFILTLYYTYYNETASRYTISEYLALPMTRTRKILTILVNNNLLTTNKGRKGTILTEQGRNLCEKISHYFKVINLFESIDLGGLVLGTINSLTAIPLEVVTQPINAINLRDASLKCGALGASIFKIIPDEEHIFKIKFIDDTIETINLEPTTYQLIKEKLYFEKNRKESWILVASTIDELPIYYFNPLFDTKSVYSFAIALVSSVQTGWELISQILT